MPKQHKDQKYTFEERDGKWYSGRMQVDPFQDWKAMDIQLTSFDRPHMRAFHMSWMSFFIAFVCWFAFAPLMSTVRTEFGMTPKQVYAVGIASVASTVSARFIVGPLCDKLGPKRCQTFLLSWITFFVFLSPLVNDVNSLALVRFAIGFGGATFVVTQYWSTQMFVSEIVGVANATTGGWGNLGGGVTQILMGWLFAMFSKVYPASKAWRMSMIVPACLTACVTAVLFFFSDDSPRGDYNMLYTMGVLETKSAKDSARRGFANINSWILGMQYACCFGIELHVNNNLAFYLANTDSFAVGVLDAAAVASLFGLMNLFARSMGGGISDMLGKLMGMRGRLLAQAICLLGEGVCLVIFSYQTTLPTLVPALICFSLCTQAAEGSTFSVVPYVEPAAIGGVCAVVGAWGNIGAILWGLTFLYGYSGKAADGFTTLGYIVIASAFLTFAVRIEGYSHLLGGEDKKDKKMNAVPTKDIEAEK